ncbi:MAG: EAL domain-containing response regulator [Alphaproteobacteria bacterium]|nr:EAL domain-containing response regulator [Alphaproteobacteria bacterium]
MTNTGDRLLIIDDEPKLAKIIARGGTMSGYAAEYTDQPDAFFSKLRAWQPSVVVVDLQMPQTDGIEVLRIMAEVGSDAKVVVCSGIDMRTIETAMRLGGELGLNMAGALNKPVRLAEIRELLEGLKSDSFETSRDNLNKAMRDDELFLVYQPKVDLRSGSVAGVEALLRWRTPAGIVLPPDSFLPFAEDQGLMDPLTDWVLQHAVDQLKQWTADGLQINLAVNISATNLNDLTLPDTLSELCRAADLPPSNLTLELTETATMNDAAKMMEVLARFRIKEFSLSIDDFGTGYSSLTQLQRLPFCEIKIDKSFVIGMDHAKESAVIAKTVVDMGHNLGLAVCAEGVENEPSLEMLRAFGCDYAQGYFFSKPVEAADIPQFFSPKARPLIGHDQQGDSDAA